MPKSPTKQWYQALVESEHSLRNGLLAAAIIIVAVIIIGIVAEKAFHVQLLGVTASEVDKGETLYYFREAPGHKTLWDLLELVIVPATLLLFGFLLGRRQDERVERDTTRREQIEREIAADRVEESVMQGYFDAMTELLLENDLANTHADSVVRELARVRTLTVVLRLSGKRKGIVLRFLSELNLIGAKGCESLINLSGANLREADISTANLPKASFTYVNLSGAHLNRANMTGAVLTHANLSACKLVRAIMAGTDLSDAKLDHSDLSYATLVKAKLDDTSLDNIVSNDDTIWPDDPSLNNQPE